MSSPRRGLRRLLSMVALGVAAASAGCPASPTTGSAPAPASAPVPTRGPAVKSPELTLTELMPASQEKIDAAGLETEIIVSPGDVLKVAGPLQLTFEVRNPGDVPRAFCDYHTPFEGIRNDLFELTDPEGKAAAYQGVMAKRAAPGLENYRVVPPRSRVRVRFDLAQAYGVAAGRHTLRFAGNDVSGLPASKPVVIDVSP